jgi:hypothetical protein
MTDVAPYHDFLLSLKGDARKVVTAAIMGTPEPFTVELRAPPNSSSAIAAIAHSCQYQGAAGLEVADPPARMKSFLDMFPNASSFSTICQTDLSAALVLTAQQVNLAVGSPCITVPLADVDPGTAGPQFDCVVEDVVGANVTRIQACGSPTCWRLVPDAQNCPSGDHLTLEIDRPSSPNPATVTTARCIVD